MSLNDVHINRFEIKDQPAKIPTTKIVEAYGLRKCPKLVLQIAGSDLSVRQNALAVVCEEFNNPYSISGSASEGAIKVLAKMVNDPDYITRERSTMALALAAKDANGLQTILDDEVIPFILNGVNDPSEVVRGNVYNCLLSVTGTAGGVDACVANGVITAFVDVLLTEVDSLKPILLKAMHNISGSEQGLLDAIEAGANGKCIQLLMKSVEYAKENGLNASYGEYEQEILTDAARTLGFMCFDGRAKFQALNKGAVKNLIGLLKHKNLPGKVKSSITIALMAISTTDLGKIQINECDGVDNIIALLYDDSKVVLLNTLKIISNIAIYPKNRALLVADSTCSAKLKRLAKSEDPTIARHSTIALDAVNWNP